MKLHPHRDSKAMTLKERLLHDQALLEQLAIIFNGMVLLVVVFMMGRMSIGPGEINMQKVSLGLSTLAVINSLLILRIRIVRNRAEFLERRASRDELTGVYNRLGFEKITDEEMRRAGRYHLPLTLCVVDLDAFKSYNESFGNKQGDELLKKFARSVSSTIRVTDVFARKHQDEFYILLPHTDLIRGQKFLHRLQTLVEAGNNVTFCAGVTAFQAGEERADFVTRAEHALTQAKREGKKQIRGFAVSPNGPAIVSF